jgi:hypothetical protein
MNKTYFRYIVAASLVLPAISILIPFLPDYQSHELANFENNQDIIWFDFVILCVFLIAIVANIALFFFKSWAKPTFTVAILFCLLSTLYYQPQIFSALEAALYSIVSLIDGLIIALIYFSPISKEFDEQSVSVNNESVEALADKISKSVLKFSIAGILVALIGYGSITIFNTINEGKISPTVSGNNLESESEVIGARTLLKRFGSEITEEISSTLAGSLLYQVDEYRNNHAQWSDAEQIDKWLGLLESSLRVEKGDKREQYEHFDSYSGAIVGVKSAMMVIPAAEKWHLLNTDNLPKNEDAIQSQAVKYLFSNLNSDNNSIKDLLEKLEKSINTLEGDNKAARLRTLYKIQTAHIMSSGEPEKILSVLNKQLFNHRTSNEVIKIPNLVKIIGNEKATHWLKQAVVAENLILEPLKGTETYTLAKN